MKKLYAIFSLVVCIQLPAQVNTYFNNDPVWTVHSQCAMPLPCIWDDTYNYYLQGDTIFDTLVYKQVFRKGNFYYNWMAPPPNFSCSGFYAYIDTVPEFFIRSFGKQVYIRFPSDTVEQWYYDFDLNVGDSLPTIGPNWEPNNVVTSIDSFSTPNGYLKIFYINSSTYECYIEGVGHMKGLVEPFGPVLECGYNLTCYGLNDTAYFPNTGPTCNMNVGIEDWVTSHQMNIFPNPVQDEFLIQLSFELKDASLTIMDMHGKVMKKMVNVSGGQISIKREGIPDGIYLVRLQENDKVLVKKIIFN